MRTLAIQYPDPWGKPAIPNKENSPPCPGWGGAGANIDRHITPYSAVLELLPAEDTVHCNAVDPTYWLWV